MFYIISWWTCLDIRQISAWWEVSSPDRLKSQVCRRSRPCLLATNISGKWISSQAQRSECWWRRFWISSSSLHYFLSSARSCLKMKRVINLFGQFMFWMGWPLIVQSRHPQTLMTGRCHWSQVTIGQSEDRMVTWLTNKKPSLLRTYHYPGLVIVSCHVGQLLSSEVKQKLIKMPAQGLLWFLLFSCELCAVDDKWARRAPV